MNYRTLPLRGLLNIRELGGYPTADGRVTRFHRFVRCELPKRLDESDLRFLRDYGVTLSMDFRSGMELRQKPSCLAEGQDWQRYFHTPTFDADPAHGVAPTTEKPEAHPETPRPPMDPFDVDWLPVYTGMVEHGTGWVRRNFETIAETEGCILYHCTTGKDRTGVFSALLLGCAGVRDADIIADYSISEIHMKPVYEAMAGDSAFGFPGGVVDWNKRFFHTPPAVMEGFLAHLRGKYGDVREFIRY